jgi:predicted ferric reductase
MKLKVPTLNSIDARLEVLDGEMLKISIPTFEHLSWKPGQHVFLRFPGIAPLDNHPFTIANTCDEIYVTAKDGRTTRRPMEFLVKPKNGITKTLMRLAENGSHQTLKTYIEGPYGGHHSNMELAYEHVILVAGGSGITSLLPLLTDLAKKVGRRGTVLKEIRLIWAVKHKHAVTWIHDQLQEVIATAPGAVTIDYYITSENGTSETSSISSGDVERAVTLVAEGEKLVQVHDKRHDFGEGNFGRPNLKQLIPAALKFERTWVVGRSHPGLCTLDLANMLQVVDL